MTPTTPSTLAPPCEAEFALLLSMARFVRSLPTGEHLPFVLRLLQAVECGGVDMVLHGDCVIEAIAQRMREGEW